MDDHYFHKISNFFFKNCLDKVYQNQKDVGIFIKVTTSTPWLGTFILLE